MSKIKLQNLEFELRYQMREMVRKEGGAVLAHTAMGQRLMRNLETVQVLKDKKAA
jgi:hypothetical protein